MIMRIFQVVTRPGKEAEFARFFHETAIPLMKGTEGIVTVLPGAARAESPRSQACPTQLKAKTGQRSGCLGLPTDDFRLGLTGDFLTRDYGIE